MLRVEMKSGHESQQGLDTKTVYSQSDLDLLRVSCEAASTVSSPEQVT
jgi:hypothetical protein